MHRSTAFLLIAFAVPSLHSNAHAEPILWRGPVAEDPVPDKRPEVATLLEKLKAHIDKKGAEDNEAIAVIDQMNQEFQKSGPKDKAAIVAALSKCFESRRLEAKDAVINNKLNLAAAVTLGHMGPQSTKTIVGWIGEKSLRKDIALQNQLVLSLGKTKDKTAIDTLIPLLENKDSSIISSAATALSEFSDVDLETRKKAFNGMLNVLMSAKGAKDGNVNDTIAREKYDTISASIITSLGKLSKHEERDPDVWLTWWNKNKGKNWDAP